MSGITAKSLILDLLSSLHAGGGRTGMPVRALVAAGELFELESNAMRVALTRLVSADLAIRDERGMYRLGPTAQAVSARVSAWRRVEQRLCAWRGGWLAVHRLHAAPRGRAQRDDTRALRLMGMRSLTPNLWLRPDNLSGRVAAVRGQLAELGLSPGAFVAGMSGLDALTEQRVRALWDVRALTAGYARSCRTLERSGARLSRMPLEKAMVESFSQGGRVLRQMALDPLLPEPLLDTAQRRALLTALADYDDRGRALWDEFLQRYGVEQQRGPLDARIAQAPELNPRRVAGAEHADG